MDNKFKTKESQLKASRNYRKRNPEKVRDICKRCSRNYYSNPEVKEKQRQRMLEYYYKKKAESQGYVIAKL